LNDDFLEFAYNKSTVDENILHKNKSKFLKVRTTSGHRAAVEEILSNPDIMARLTDVKVIDEVFLDFVLVVFTVRCSTVGSCIKTVF
jgi:protein pelota